MAAAPTRDVLLVDLSGSERHRRLVRQVASAYLRTVAALGGRRVDLLLYAPRGEGLDLAWPGNVRVHTPAELLDGELCRQIDAWVLRASQAAVAAAPGPIVSGVDLALLHLTLLQDDMREHALLTLAMRVLLRREGAARWGIASADSGMADAVSDDLARVVSGRRLVLCRIAHWLHRLGTRARHRVPDVGGPTLSSRPITEGCTQVRATVGAPDVLLLEQSRPVAGMCDALAPTLRSAGISVLRLRCFDGAEAVADGLLVPAPDARRRAAPDDGVRWAAVPDELPAFADGTDLSPRWRALLAKLHRMYDTVQRAYVEDVASALDVLQPRLLVVGNDRWWVGQAAVRLAQARGITTVALQDGVMFAMPRAYWLLADCALVNGGHMRDALVTHGAAPERVQVVGQPRYDAYRRTPPEATARRMARERLGLRSDGKLYLVAAQPDQSSAFAASVVDALLEAADADVLLRPHPSMPAAPLVDLVRARATARLRLDPGMPLEELLPLIDLLVIQNSTLGIEAALAGVPVIACNLTGLPDLVPYGALGLATAVTSLEELRDVVQRGVLSRASVAAIEYLIGPLDGQAAVRVTDAMAVCLSASGAARAAVAVPAGPPPC